MSGSNKTPISGSSSNEDLEESSAESIEDGLPVIEGSPRDEPRIPVEGGATEEEEGVTSTPEKGRVSSIEDVQDSSADISEDSLPPFDQPSVAIDSLDDGAAAEDAASVPDEAVASMEDLQEFSGENSDDGLQKLDDPQKEENAAGTDAAVEVDGDTSEAENETVNSSEDLLNISAPEEESSIDPDAAVEEEGVPTEAEEDTVKSSQDLGDSVAPETDAIVEGDDAVEEETAISSPENDDANTSSDIPEESSAEKDESEDGISPLDVENSVERDEADEKEQEDAISALLENDAVTSSDDIHEESSAQNIEDDLSPLEESTTREAAVEEDQTVEKENVASTAENDAVLSSHAILESSAENIQASPPPLDERSNDVVPGEISQPEVSQGGPAPVAIAGPSHCQPTTAELPPCQPVKPKGVIGKIARWAEETSDDLMIVFDVMTGLDSVPCNMCDLPQGDELGLFEYMYELAKDIVAEAMGTMEVRDRLMNGVEPAQQPPIEQNPCVPNPSPAPVERAASIPGPTAEVLTLELEHPDEVLVDNSEKVEASEVPQEAEQEEHPIQEPNEVEGPEQDSSVEELRRDNAEPEGKWFEFPDLRKTSVGRDSFDSDGPYDLPEGFVPPLIVISAPEDDDTGISAPKSAESSSQEDAVASMEDIQQYSAENSDDALPQLEEEPQPENEVEEDEAVEEEDESSDTIPPKKSGVPDTDTE